MPSKTTDNSGKGANSSRPRHNTHPSNPTPPAIPTTKLNESIRNAGRKRSSIANTPAKTRNATPTANADTGNRCNTNTARSKGAEANGGFHASNSNAPPTATKLPPSNPNFAAKTVTVAATRSGFSASCSK
ncbi:MAG TPA: hypothetical protein VGS57_05675 [Thermoanaerobaculia bacterium]|nr:hypothetical protein [Thermoanaerobaculia bacterium]